MYKAFQNVKLEHVRCLKEAALVAAFGLRTCIVMNDELDVLCKFLDANRDEKYHCGEFFINTMESFCSRNKYFLALAGETGVIKILDLQDGELAAFLTGHTGAIFDLKIFGNFAISGGEDRAVRLWDLEALKCIGVFGGMFGHRDCVLSLDVLFDSSMIVSTGTDCTIRQWKINRDKYLSYDPFTTFSTVHRCPITKVRYYGSMVASLSNNMISVVLNNRACVDPTLNLSKNDVFLLGSIDLFNNCKTFEISGHILIGMGTNGDLYMFDLESLGGGNKPFLTSTAIDTVDDFAVMNNFAYASSGNGIWKVPLDFGYFR